MTNSGLVSARSVLTTPKCGLDHAVTSASAQCTSCSTYHANALCMNRNRWAAHCMPTYSPRHWACTHHDAGCNNACTLQATGAMHD